MLRGNTTIELGAGWAKTELATCDKEMKCRLDIIGGSP
jgi:hypothetical protein